jgi:hypothetical protein
MMMLHPPTKSKILFSSLALGLVASVTASESMPYVRTRDLPGVANPDAALWVSMNKDVQFLPVDDLPKKRSSKRARSLQDNESGDQEEGGGEEYYEEVEAGETGEWEGYDPYSVQPFVEGMGEYDEYQQAWRLLGFMIDCNYVSSGEQDEHGGSGSADTTDEGCARYVLWAAVSTLGLDARLLLEEALLVPVWTHSLTSLPYCYPMLVCRLGVRRGWNRRVPVL